MTMGVFANRTARGTGSNGSFGTTPAEILARRGVHLLLFGRAQIRRDDLDPPVRARDIAQIFDTGNVREAHAVLSLIDHAYQRSC